MKNILLPTDFSKNSINAIHYALELLKDEECQFYKGRMESASVNLENIRREVSGFLWIRRQFK